MYGGQRDHGGGPDETMGTGAMSKLAEGVEVVEEGRVDEPQAHDERLLIAKHITQVMLAAGIDCELAEEASTH